MSSSLARLAIAWCTLFVVGTDLFVVSPLLPLIGRSLDCGPAAAGLSLTAFATSYMICAPLMGYVADRMGRRQVLSWGLAGFAVANLLTAASPSLAWLVGARMIAGATTASVSPSVYALVGESAPEGRRATWMAIAVSGLLVSLSVGAPLGTVFGAGFGWARVFDVLVVLALLLTLANRVIWGADPKPAAAPGADQTPVSAKFGQRLLPTVIWSTALYGMYTYLGTWLARLGFSTDQVAQVVMLYGAGALVGALGGGRIADIFGPKAATSASLLGLFVCFALLPLTLHSGLAIGIGFGLASAVAQTFFPAQQAALVADFPTRRATVLAWNNSCLFLGIALGSVIGGQAVTMGSFAASLFLCAATALAGWMVNRVVAPGRQTGISEAA